MGVLFAADEVRPGMATIVEDLRRRGLSVRIASGDRMEPVCKAAEEVGIAREALNWGTSPGEQTGRGSRRAPATNLGTQVARRAPAGLSFAGRQLHTGGRYTTVRIVSWMRFCCTSRVADRRNVLLKDEPLRYRTSKLGIRSFLAPSTWVPKFSGARLVNNRSSV